MSRWPSRRMPVAPVIAVLAVAVIGAVLFIAWPRQAPGPDLDGIPAEALAPDLPALSLDGEVVDGDLAHDSRSDEYRLPFGAVPAGTEVTLRLRAAAGDLEDATVRVWDALAEAQILIPMAVVARDATGGIHGYDYWEVSLPTTKIPSLLYYRFIVRDGPTTRYLEDDALLDGGSGEALDASEDRSWQLVTYDPAFETPAWAQGAVVYQIFPDRFANGDPTNDPSPDATATGADGAERYRHGDVYGNAVLPRDWESDMPEGFCRAYAAPAEPCGEEPLGRDFFGGDLAGIREHLPALGELGVTVLYLNPIFAAPSNHRYDTSDYTVVDPDLGTRDDLEALVTDAEALGIRVLLDGVFNHTSSDSPFFDRSERFEEVGACESADSEWASWYTFSPGPPAKCYDGTTYTDWFGFDTLAVLEENPDTYSYFFGDEGVATRWLEVGIGGWRLDVMNEISHEFLRGLRRSVKGADPDALILGEEWGDASAWLLGTEVDSIMNYRFRRAVIGLINGDTADADGAISGLTPSEFAATMDGLREDYPPAAWNVLHNLVDSHDTTRILWTLAPGGDNREEKESPGALEAAATKLRSLAALQLTWPGMAGIYYGTEVGLTGHDDPDDRRPFPWTSQDAALRASYVRLGQLRAEHEALRTGDLTFLLADDAATTLAFGRRTDAEATITVLNLGDEPRSIVVPTEGWLPAGVQLTDALGGAAYTSDDEGVALELPAHGSALLITDAGADLAPPAAPASLTADATTAGVTLAWDAADDAAGYLIWRSVLSGGGYRIAGSADGDVTTWTDLGARHGTMAHFVVTAFDRAGNESDRSPEATALPQLALDDVRLASADPLEQPLSAVEPGTPIEVILRADPFSGRAGAAVGVRLELGFGPSGSTASADAEGWIWSPMAYIGEAENGAERWTGTVRPEATGAYAVVARVSTDGGASWAAVGTDGFGPEARTRTLVAAPPADNEPPATPSGLVATSVTETAVSLAWQPVADDDLFRYEVMRASGDEDLERIGVASDPSFTDTSVSAGRTYRYAVRAQDAVFNRSAESASIEVGAEVREVAVTFTVHVPATTPAADIVFIAGDFQGWDPGGTPMTRIDQVTWKITLTFPEATPLQYKYARGTWDAVEKDAGCGEIPNRELTVQYGTDGTLAQDDEVAKWRDVDACP